MVELEIDREDVFGILEATRQVMETAQDVELVTDSLPIAADELRPHLRRILTAKRPEVSEIGYRTAVQRIFIENAVNFCFWAEKGQEKWAIEGPQEKPLSGSIGMRAAIRRAIAEGVPLLQTEFLTFLSEKDLRHVFRSCNGVEIPLLDRRLASLHNVGAVLSAEYDGYFTNLIEDSSDDAVQVTETLVYKFPSFCDTSPLADDEDVPFFKRAQLTAYDISLIQNSSVPHLQNIDQLTAFADYKVPQVLRELGVIRYSPELAAMVDDKQLIERDSSEELEIRSATIWGVELLRQLLGEAVTAVQVDNALWWAGQDRPNMKPHHRTYTIFY